MAKKDAASANHRVSAQPRLHQRGPRTPGVWHCLGPPASRTEEPVRLEMTEQLNQLLADTMTLRDLYKKSHWQVRRPHLLSTPPPFLTSTMTNRTNWWTALLSESTSGWNQPGHGARRGGGHADRASAARQGRSPGADFPSAGRAPGDHSARSQAGEPRLDHWR